MHQYLYDYYLKTLSPEKTEAFELHLLRCKKCQEEMARLDLAFKTLEQQPNQSHDRHKKPVEKQPERNRARSLMTFAMAAILILALGWIGLSSMVKPPYFQLARLNGELQIENFRGAITSSDFQSGLEKLQNRDFAAAIAAWQQQVQTQPDDYQTNYLIGLAYLAEGERSFLGVRRFSATHSRQAVTYLQKALSLAGTNQYHQEQCLWLLGKAWLRLKNIEEAKQSWQAIVALAVPDLIFKSNAQQGLQQLEMKK